eukprot:TRINITY_DN6941_c0_g1_i1.p2 TRINITY_DN6941_c0_g1~~TRINITY_DN6941_c0_g1_i1.p2  ORF type:complete len:136 (+),score=3.88 TRINITY_DN6941_c0_g1_i1:186-593(+)
MTERERKVRKPERLGTTLCKPTQRIPLLCASLHKRQRLFQSPASATDASCVDLRPIRTLQQQIPLFPIYQSKRITICLPLLFVPSFGPPNPTPRTHSEKTPQTNHSTPVEPLTCLCIFSSFFDVVTADLCERPQR